MVDFTINIYAKYDITLFIKALRNLNKDKKAEIQIHIILINYSKGCLDN